MQASPPGWICRASQRSASLSDPPLCRRIPDMSQPASPAAAAAAVAIPAASIAMRAGPIALVAAAPPAAVAIAVVAVGVGIGCLLYQMGKKS